VKFQYRIKHWRLAFVILLAASCLKSFSQEIFKSTIDDPKLKNIEGFAADGYVVVKGQGEIGNSIAFIIDPAREQLSFYPLRSASPHVVGWQSSDDDISLYYSVGDPEKGRDINCLTFSKNRKKFVDKAIQGDEGSEKFLSYLNFNNTFHRLALNTDEQQMIIRTYSKEKLEATIRISIEDEKIFKHIKKEKFTFIEDLAEVPFDDAADLNKMYFRDNTLTIVIDDWKDGGDMGAILICTAELNTRTFRTKVLHLTSDSHTDHNSFLYKSNLNVLAVDKDFISINVYDIESLDRIKQVRYLKGEKLALKNSFLVKDGKNVDLDWEGKWKDEMISNYTFKFLNRGTPVISVSSAGDEYYRLLIGNLKKPDGDGRTFVPGGVSGPGGAVPTSTVQVKNPEITYFYGYLSDRAGIPAGATNPKLLTTWDFIFDADPFTDVHRPNFLPAPGCQDSTAGSMESKRPNKFTRARVADATP
jgi:hypothetical protein